MLPILLAVLCLFTATPHTVFSAATPKSSSWKFSKKKKEKKRRGRTYHNATLAPLSGQYIPYLRAQELFERIRTEKTYNPQDDLRNLYEQCSDKKFDCAIRLLAVRTLCYIVEKRRVADTAPVIAFLVEEKQRLEHRTTKTAQDRHWRIEKMLKYVNKHAAV